MPTIISGKRRGAKLLAPTTCDVRPTLARVKEALFSMLASELQSFQGLRVLDPFAGTGALGLEAWSRGATHVDLFESHTHTHTLLKKNILRLQAQNECHAHLGASPAAWKQLPPPPYDLILCDPPYAANLLTSTLNALLQNTRIHSSSLISLETAPQAPLDLPHGLAIIKQRQYGDCLITLVTQQNHEHSEHTP